MMGHNCLYHHYVYKQGDLRYVITDNAKIKVAVSVDKQRTLIRIYMEKYNSV